ncbi:KRAB [Mytilus edulis]|uniref:KRAB n=1 Tax=Mytilus edulis TaxID=6550 RepID=A0A8S3T3M6_MYTED|nr:KRAB [Mytilus edulis]
MHSEENKAVLISKEENSSKCDEAGNSQLKEHEKTQTLITNGESVKCNNEINKLDDSCPTSKNHTGTVNGYTHTTDVKGEGQNEKEKIQAHLKIYASLKPFKCKDCGKEFWKESSLQTHMIQHSGEKPFKCKECGKGFMGEKPLKSHYLVHSGERPSL